MLKLQSNGAAFGYLRDIRVSVSKPSASGRVTAAGASPRNVIEAAEEALRSREEAGYARGKREAEEEHKRDLDQLREQWHQEWETANRAEVLRVLETISQKVHQQVSEMFKSLEKHATMLAGEAAVKLTAGIPVSADMVEAYVREAMNLVEQDTEITVVLHPLDLALLQEHQSSLLNRAGTSPVLHFRPDEKIGRGGCMVETKFGELDARRDTKIELLRKAVNE